MTQGDRVKDVRKTLKLTLEEFGKKVGVTKQTVSRIENGINNLTDQMVKSICREFNVNYDWLMDGEGEMFSDLPQTVLDELCSQYELDDLDRFIVELYVGLPKDVRDGIKGNVCKSSATVPDTTPESPFPRPCVSTFPAYIHPDILHLQIIPVHPD